MSDWKIEHKEGDPDGCGQSYSDTCWFRPGVMAGDITSVNAVTLTEGYQYNGSGRQAFGGAQKWPVVKLHFDLPAGREDLRTEIAERLRKFVDEVAKEHGLEAREEEEATAVNIKVSKEHQQLVCEFWEQYNKLTRRDRDFTSWLQLKFSCSRQRACDLAAWYFMTNHYKDWLKQRLEDKK